MIGFVEDSKTRKMIRIHVYPTAKKSVEEYANKEGMTEQAILSRLVEFFDKRPEVFKDWMLGKVREAFKAEALRQIIQHIEAESGAPFKGGADAEPIEEEKKINGGPPSRRGRR